MEIPDGFDMRTLNAVLLQKDPSVCMSGFLVETFEDSFPEALISCGLCCKLAHQKGEQTEG